MRQRAFVKIALQVGPRQIKLALVMLNFINLIKNCIRLNRIYSVFVEEKDKFSIYM